MALIVEYHVIADMYPVGTAAIRAGMTVALGTDGAVVPSATGQLINTVLGVAGDSALSAEGQTTAYSDNLVIGSDGAGTRWTANRVSDNFDETLASQKITVYNGGGKFWISDDLFDSDGSTAAINELVGRSGLVAGEWAIGATVGQELGICVGAAQSYGSGVPGTEVDGHLALETAVNNQWIPVVLRR
jgi:hypothetical protein